jgi:transposase
MEQLTIGCDLGDRWTQICVVAGGGESIEEARVRTTPAGFRRYFSVRPTGRAVIEVGTHSSWVADLLAELGHDVVVANPRVVRLIYANRNKHDRLDAEALARLGRIDPNLLSPVRHRGRQFRADLALIRARDELVQARCKLVNHVRGVVKSAGGRLAGCETATFHRKAQETIPPSLRAALNPILVVLEQLTEQIRHHERLIADRAERAYPETSRLTQVHGVGSLTALAFVLTLGDADRFEKSRTVGAFLGLARRQRQSGESDPALGITKHGDRYLRRLLVGCAHRILGPFGEDSDLRRWGLEIAKRGGRGGKRRAVVAVARKLSVILHRLWISGEEYVPIGYTG